MKKLATRLTFYSLWALGLVFILFPVVVSFGIPDEIQISREEFEQSQPLGVTYIRNLRQSTTHVSQVGEDDTRFIELKLFGKITVRRIKVDFFPHERVLAGGIPIGYTAETRGLIVTKGNDEFDIKRGDVIISVNGVDVNCPRELEKLVKPSAELVTKLLRKGKEITKTLTPQNGLGIFLKNETTGIGMLTYINPENNNFAALGHMINDFETGATVNIQSGKIYRTEIHSIEKSEGKRVGHFKSTLLKGKYPVQGHILSSNKTGVFGCLTVDSSVATGESVGITSRFNVKPGKAVLRTSLDGKTTEDFEIEIIKNRFQKTPDIKSLVVRIVDKRILNASGGIIHGMSGSPILQDGKLVGALTHVMVDDVTKGYGIYIDFMQPRADKSS